MPLPAFVDGITALTEDAKALARECSVIRRIHKLTGPPPLRDYGLGLPGLARIVVNQQLSTASAGAIWERVRVAVAPLDALSLEAAMPETLAQAGLSRAKIATLKAIAAAVLAGRLDFAVLDAAEDSVVREQLTAIRGIGPWTADIYLLFCLGRRDAFAPGDLALQLAAQAAFGLPDRPGAMELELLAERWRPRRAVAARLLWAYYGLPKG